MPCVHLNVNTVVKLHSTLKSICIEMALLGFLFLCALVAVALHVLPLEVVILMPIDSF